MGRKAALVVLVSVLVALGAGCAPLGLGDESPRPTLRRGPLDLGTGTTLSGDGGPEFYERHYEPGQCLDWDPDDRGTTATVVVDCALPHLAEVVGDIDLRDEHGDTAPYPGDDGWEAILEARCGAAAQAYLGRALTPTDPLATAALHPKERAWAGGERTVTCTLSAPSESDNRVRVTGRATDILAGGARPAT